MPPKADRGAKCPQEGCSQRLSQATMGTCKGCGRDFCKNHCFPSDHGCQGPAASLARSSSAPQLAKQPVASGLGVLVSAATTKAARCALGHLQDATASTPDSQPLHPLLQPSLRIKRRRQGVRHASRPPPVILCCPGAWPDTDCGTPQVQAQAAAGAAAAAASALAAQLDKADTRSLLDALLSTSPSAGGEAQPLLVRALGEEAAEVRACRAVVAFWRAALGHAP